MKNIEQDNYQNNVWPLLCLLKCIHFTSCKIRRGSLVVSLIRAVMNKSLILIITTSNSRASQKVPVCSSRDQV